MLNLSKWMVREHVGMLKLTDTYDILDPETQQQVGIAKERPGFVTHLLRLLVKKRLLPTTVYVYEGTAPEGKEAFSIQRGMNFLVPKVHVRSGDGELLGTLRPKMWSLKCRLRLLDEQGTDVGLLEGDWKGWNFRFLTSSGEEMGVVTKKWAGLAKELFTSADNYMIALSGEADPGKAALLLAAGLAVDILLKER
jgi:uncharacterized protein YxjI